MAAKPSTSSAPATVTSVDLLETVPAAKKINWDKLDPQIEYRGRHLTLPGEPGEMPIDEGIKLLQRVKEDQEQVFHVFEIIDAFPHDGAVAFVKAMKQLYGWASPQTVMTFFGPKPPSMLTVKTGPNITDVIQCPLGAFKLPNVENLIHTMFHVNDKGEPVFLIHGEMKKKNRQTVLNRYELFYWRCFLGSPLLASYPKHYLAYPCLCGRFVLATYLSCRAMQDDARDISFYLCRHTDIQRH